MYFCLVHSVNKDGNNKSIVVTAQINRKSKQNFEMSRQLFYVLSCYIIKMMLNLAYNSSNYIQVHVTSTI
jgi:hypothetical protein